MRDPLALPALAFILGIAVAAALGLNASDGFLLLLPSLPLWLAAHRWGGSLSAMAACALCFGSLGAWRFASNPLPVAPPTNSAPGETMRLEGCVVDPPVRMGDRVRFVLETQPGARVRVNAQAAFAAHLRYGHQVAGEARVFDPPEFRNPGGFDFAAWLARRHIFWVASSSATQSWKVEWEGCGAPLAGWIRNTRAALLDRTGRVFERNPYQAAMMRGLLLGDSSAIERVWVEDFRRTGTYHALVISGGHVAFLTGLFLLWLRLVRTGAPFVLATAALVAWTYALLAGADAPVLRSAAGFTLYAAARLFFRRARLLNLLSLVAMLFLWLDPLQLFEASFQLSFLAVAAIALFAEPLTERHLRIWSQAAGLLLRNTPQAVPDTRSAALAVEASLWARTVALATGTPHRVLLRFFAKLYRAVFWTGSALLVSACVQLALALPMILYFHRVSWTGLTANLVVTPLVTLAIPFGFLAVLTGAPWAASAASALLDAARALARWHAGWEFSLRVPDPPLWLVLLLGLLFCLSALWVRRGWGYLPVCFAALTSALLLAVWRPFPASLTQGQLELTAIDVGTGDSLLIATPEGRTALVDAGGMPARPGASARLDTGEDVVSPYLWRRGIRRLDTVVLTHLDHDHSGGMEAILRNFRPREFWVGPLPLEERAARLLTLANSNGAAIRGLAAGTVFSWGGADWQVLAPPRVAARRNDSSLVLRVSYGRQAMLLTGDLERQGEARLLAEGGLRYTQVLKVAHHGSRTGTSVSFLTALQPAIALISAGRHNRFGFPHESVLEALAAQRTLVLRTDHSGAVGVRTNGRSLEMLPAGRQGLPRFAPWGAD
jgi:competence protein ComEC